MAPFWRENQGKANTQQCTKSLFKMSLGEWIFNLFLHEMGK
jgi:hypothetical protein